MTWYSLEHSPVPEGVYVLTFSPVYQEGEAMRYRILDAQFVRLAIEVTHWAYLEPPE